MDSASTCVRFEGDSVVHEMADGGRCTKCGVATESAQQVECPPDCYDCGWVMLAQHGAGAADTDETGVIRSPALGPVNQWHLAHRANGVNTCPKALCDDRDLGQRAERRPLADWNSQADDVCRECDRSGRSRGIVP